MKKLLVLYSFITLFILPLRTWACIQPPNERAYKLTGTCNSSLLNGAKPMAQAIFDDVVLYPNPFVVVTPRGYTNHYYAGSERIASRIGEECWNTNPFDDYEKPAPEWEALELFQGLSNEKYPFGTADDWNSSKIENITPYVDYIKEVQYQCGPVELMDIELLYKFDNLYDAMDCKFGCQGEDVVYYYHPDHLGSTSWVTNFRGDEQQFIAYMPYGEPLLDITFDKYDCRYGQNDARYKFTGKERDWETGYDYVEQRYYWWPGGFWLRTDPLLDKYLNLSPYAYCNGNPLRIIDPNGMDIYRYDDQTGDFHLYQRTNDSYDQIGKFKYDKKTNEYRPRLKINGSIKTYSDHLRNNDKIAKGILRDGLNIKENGAMFISDNTKGPSLSDFHNFALILDEVAGVEISGYVLEAPGEKNRKLVQFEPYKNNTIDRSSNRLMNFAPYSVYQHFHTHGHAGHNKAITPSKDYDIPFKDDVTSRYPGLQLLILHNYGAPIKY